jgi:hypothetical protein
MGAAFVETPIEPSVVAVQVMKIYFDAPRKYSRDRRRNTSEHQSGRLYRQIEAET